MVEMTFHVQFGRTDDHSQAVGKTPPSLLKSSCRLNGVLIC